MQDLLLLGNIDERQLREVGFRWGEKGTHTSRTIMLDQVKAAVKAAGKEFYSELHDLYVSPILAKAVLDADPSFASDLKAARAALRAQFPVVEDISTNEFIRLVREVLSVDGQIPCTVIVLDEIQLFIGNDPGRSTDVQEVAEALCKQLDSRVLLIGAGQTALAGNVPLLQRLIGRFTIPVELSDSDVETVTRRVVLAKKADKHKAIEDTLDSHAGEINRQLAGSDSPIIYVYVPKASADDLQKAIVEYEAAKSTVEFKGTPTTPEGREARDAMATRMATAEASRNQIVKDVIDRAKVFQGGGGGERFELNLVAKVESAAQASLDRLFPNFKSADDNRWASVINRAKNGDEAALSAVDWTDVPEKHPICAAVLSEVGSGKRGKEVRDAFEASPYGWSRDAVDAALITRQKDGVKRGEGGAEDRLAAAVELQNRLKAILEGEPPFDIFVRWKPLAKHPIGWEPDINDGVRVNIRPFLASDLPGGRTGAGILRYKPNIKWTKDRGKEPERPKAEYPWFWNWDENTEDFMGGKTFDGNRWNNCHYTSRAKHAARDAAGKDKP